MGITKRGPAQFQVFVDMHRGADGKRQKRTIGTFRTKKEAEVAEREAMMARDRGIDLVPGKVTVGDLMRRYLDDTELRLGASGVKTIQEYRTLNRLRIEPRFGLMPLEKLRPTHVNEWKNDLLTKGRVSRKNPDRLGLGAKSVRHTYALLNAALKWAVRMQLAYANPCDACAAPSVPKSVAKPQSPDAYHRIMEAAAGTRWETIIMFAAGTGMRRGEIAALRWDSVALEARTLVVRSSIADLKARGAEAELRVKATKSTLVREIPISPLAAEALRRARVIQNQDKLASNPGEYDDRGFVFAPKKGGMLRPHAITKAFGQICARAGVATTAFHSLRHTAATAMLMTMDPVTVASILGHDPAVLLRIYAHAIDERKRTAVASIDAYLALGRRDGV